MERPCAFERNRWTIWVELLLLALLLVGCGSHEDAEPVSFHTVDTDPDWSPDGRLIAFASSRQGGGIYVIRPDGTGLRALFHGNASNVDWSPDGQGIAYQGSDGIYVISRHGGHATRILRGGRFSLPAWAPDGRRLAIVEWERDLSTVIAVVRPDGTGLRRLLPPSVARSATARNVDAASETEPAWAPGGHQIAFQAGDGRIVAVNVTNGRRRLIATRAYEPAWSPDGKLIAFEFQGALWAARADGSGGRRLLAETGGDPSWAPDSRGLVFEVRHWYGRYTRRPQSLSVVDATGQGLRKLTFGGSVWDDTEWRGDRATP